MEIVIVLSLLLLSAIVILRIVADDSIVRLPLFRFITKYGIETNKVIISVSFDNKVVIKSREEHLIYRSIPLFLFYKDYLKVEYKAYSNKDIIGLSWERSKDYSTAFSTEEKAKNFLEDMKNNPKKYQFYVL